MNPTPDITSLEQAAAETRLRVIEMSCRAKTAHLGGALSSIDILTALYGAILKIDPKQPGALATNSAVPDFSIARPRLSIPAIRRIAFNSMQR